MRSYNDVCLVLEIKKVCFGGVYSQSGKVYGCGLSRSRHRRGVLDPFGVVHWEDRRITRAGLRRFLLLVARRDRENNPEFLNSPDLAYYAIYWDSTEAGRLAGSLGVRLPAVLSRNDRLRTLTAARKAGVHLSSVTPAIYAWARRAL